MRRTAVCSMTCCFDQKHDCAVGGRSQSQNLVLQKSCHNEKNDSMVVLDQYLNLKANAGNIMLV